MPAVGRDAGGVRGGREDGVGGLRRCGRDGREQEQRGEQAQSDHGRSNDSPIQWLRPWTNVRLERRDGPLGIRHDQRSGALAYATSRSFCASARD